MAKPSTASGVCRRGRLRRHGGRRVRSEPYLDRDGGDGIPQTSVLGAILISGFLGGAISTHFRLGEVGSPPQLICLLLGVLTWGGLYFRDPRVRALLPLRA